MDDDRRLIGVFTESGYSYPGSPYGAVELLVRELRRLRDEADSARRDYAVLLHDVGEAVEAAPHFGDGPSSDPVREVARLAAHLKSLKSNKSGQAVVSDAVLYLRKCFPEQSAAHAGSGAFLEALAERVLEAEPTTRVVETSVAYWRAMLNADAAALPMAAVRWSSAVEQYALAEED